MFTFVAYFLGHLDASRFLKLTTMRYFLTLAVIFFLSISGLYAQVDNNLVRIEIFPEDVRPCDTSFVEVEVLYKATQLKFLTIQFDLPTGVTYIPGSFEWVINPDLHYSESTVSNAPSSPVFQISPDKNLGDGTVPLGDVIRFKFAKRVGCDAIDELNNGVIFKDVQIVQLTQGSIVHSFSNVDPDVSNYQVFIPALALQSIPDKDVIVGQTVGRNIKMVQGGEGRLKWYVHKVSVGSEIGYYKLSYNGTPLTPDSIAGSDYFYYIHLDQAPFAGNVGDGDNYFENGEKIQFQETFQVQGCKNVDVIHQGFWGCSLSELCQSSEPEMGVLNFQGSAPEITVTKIAGDNYMDLCGGQNFTIRVENIATHPGAMAKDLNVNFGLGHNASPLSDFGKNPLWAFDFRDIRHISNIRINGNPVATSNWTSTIYPGRGSGKTIRIPYDYFTTDPDGAGGLDDIDGDGYYDDLAPGEHIDISFDYEYIPEPDNCGEKRFDYIHWEHLYIDAMFRDQCANERYTERINFEYSNIIRDYLNETLVSWPNGVSDGEDFTVGVKPHFYRGGWTTLGRPKCGGEDMFTGSGVVWSVELTVPNGVSLAAGAPAGFSQSGNTITYTQSGYQYKYYNFPLTFDCASYSGPEKFTISYKTHYHCSCWDTDVHCGSVEIQNLCPTTCKGPSILAFDAHRTVAGWTDWDKTTRVVLDDTYELDRYLAKDTMEIDLDAVIQDSAVQNLFLDIDYTTEAGGGDENLFTFIDGDIAINDLSSGVYTGTISTDPTRTALGANQYKMAFDLSSYKNLVSSTYQYGEGNENDTVRLKLRFVVSPNFNYTKYFKLQNFQATFYAKNGTNTTGCGTLYEKASYLKPNRHVSTNSEIKTWYCTPTDQRLFFTYYSDVGDLFPNEFRNPTQWDSTVVIMPKGARFTGNVRYFNYNTSYNPAYSESNGGVTWKMNGDTLTVYPGPNYRDMDQRGTNYPRLLPEFIGTCEAAPDVYYQYTVYYQEFAHVAPEPKSKTSSVVFHYFRPQFELHSPHPNVTVVNNETYVDVQICNTSPIPIDYNWVKVNANPNFVVTKAFLLDDADNEIASANMTQSNGMTWVEAGQVMDGPSGCKTIRIYGNIQDCGDQTLTLSNGWDCLKYPDDYESLDPICSQDSININLTIQESQVQVTIVQQPDSISYCDPFVLGLEVNSAQVANLLNPYLLVSIPADISNMMLDSVTVEYPKGSGNVENLPTSIVGNSLKIDLAAHSKIGSKGMLGSYLESQDSLRIASVKMYMALSCGFLNLSTVTVQGFGESPCAKPAASSGVTLTCNDIAVKGANTSYYVYSDFTLPDTIKNCGTIQTIDVKSTIIAGTTGVVDSADITIPNGLTFVNGSFNCIGANCATYEYAYSSGGEDHFVIAFPQGVGNKDSIKYQFDVQTSNSYCTDKGYFDIESYIYSTGGSCGTSACAATKIVTGHQIDSLAIAKPDLVILSSTVATSMVTSAGDTKYGLNLNIQNVGIDAMSGYNYTVYCADGSGNKGTQIYAGNFPDILLSGDSLSQIFYFYASTACNPANGLFLEILPSNANCMCSAVTAVIPLTPGMDANDDNYTTPEDVVLSANVTDNDTPATGITVNTTPITDVTNGTLTLNSDGSFTYTPDANYNGTDSFVYQVCDSGNPQQCDTATVTITVTPVNDPPIAVDDNYTTPEDTPLSGDVSTNDSDPDGGTLTVNTTPVFGTFNGALTLNSDGTFTYTPNLNYNGLDSFSYVICNDGTPSLCDTALVLITVTPINDKPVAQDDNYTTPEETLLTGNVTDNDSDSEGGVTVSTTPLTDVSHGTLTLNSDGTFTYTPDLNYVGLDSFVYKICDNGTPALCDTATVTITVTPVNDPPIAVDDAFTTPEDTPLSATVTTNDSDVEGALTVSTTPVLDVSNGTLTLNSDGTFTYTPNLNYNGLDSFYYQVCDTGMPVMCDTALVLITVTPINDKPVAQDDNYTTPEETLLTGNVTDNDSDPEGSVTVSTTPLTDVSHGTLTLNSDGTFTYTPDLNYVGLDSFVYTICDSGTPALCDTATVTITVTPVNDPPIAVDDHYTTDTNLPITTENVTDNDNDIDGDGLVVNTTPLNGPTYGTLVLNADGSFTYTPATNFNGYDQFDYVVCDTGTPTLCDTATVFIKIGNLEVVISNPDTLDCATPVVTLDGSGSSQGVSFTYTWTTATGHIVSGANTHTATVDMPGEYTLTLLDTVSNITTSSSTVVVLDTLAPTAVIVEPHGDITCSSSSVFLSGNGSDVGPNYTYQWTTTDGNILNGANTLIPEVGHIGSYQLEVRNTINGCISTISTEVKYDTVSPVAMILTPTEEINCSTSCITLDATGSSTGDYNYIWTSSNGSIQGTNTTLQATVCASGDYEFKVTSIANGCTATQTIHVSENTTPPTLTTTANQKITCDIPQVYVDVNVSGGSGDYAYVWSPASAIESGDTTSNPLVNQAGNYTVTVTDNNSGCTATASAMVEATIDVPQLSLVGNDTLTCLDTLVPITAYFNSNFDVNWSTVDGSITTLVTEPKVWVNQPGEYTAVVTNSATGCTSSKTITIHSDTESPLAEADDVQKNDCTTTAVQLGSMDNASMTNVRFEWTTVDGHFVSSNDLPNPIVDKIGTYRLRVTDLHNGCSSEDEVVVSEVAPLTGADMTLSLPGCDGRTGAIIINDVEGSKAPFTYSFDGGDHFGVVPIAAGLYPGDYEVVIQDEVGCEYRETVHLPVPKEGDIVTEADVEMEMGDSIHLEIFTSTSPEAIDTIIWTPEKDLSCTGNCFKQTVKPMITTIYNIVVIDTLGCISKTQTTVHVSDPDIYIPNIFTPNDGNGQNDYFTVLGNTERVEEIESMEIFDRWGGFVFSRKHLPINDYSSGWDGTWRGKRVQEGVYIYKIKVRFIDGHVVDYMGDINVTN